MKKHTRENEHSSRMKKKTQQGSGGRLYRAFPLLRTTARRTHLDLADAAGHEVEQLLVLEVADSGAVGALDVIGDDLHGGHDGHAGFVADQKRAAQLVRVRLLSDLLKSWDPEAVHGRKKGREGNGKRRKREEKGKGMATAKTTTRWSSASVLVDE